MAAPPLTESQFEMLRTAVTLARNEAIDNVACLRLRLLQCFPGEAQDVEHALEAWARYEQAKRNP